MTTNSNCMLKVGNALVANSEKVCEAQLVESAKKGHPDAFGELYARHSQKILRATLRITRNRQDAEDALQDTFLNAFVHLGSFDGRSSFSTWLTRIAINSALMKLRKIRACSEISRDTPLDAFEDSVTFDPVDPRPDPEEQLAQQQREHIVMGAISKLRPALRQAIDLRRFQEFSIKETARTLSVSIQAAKSRLHHARTKLRQMPDLQALGKRQMRQVA